MGFDAYSMHSPGKDGQLHDSKKGGSQIEPRHASASRIQNTVDAFAAPGISEEELDKKLETAMKIKHSRNDHDNLLKEILEVKMNGASAARYKAALALFESAKDQVVIAIDNVAAFESYQNKAEVKIALLDILKARNLAAYAISKRICAQSPRKYDEWCKFEEETDPAIMELNQTINQFFISKKITEEMKIRG